MQTLFIKKLVLHSDFSPSGRNAPSKNDIALIQFYPSERSGRCVIFDQDKQPACLPRQSDRFDESSTCHVSGWGDTETNERGIQYSSRLQIARLHLDDFAQCQADFERRGHIHLDCGKHMCASAETSDSCLGDSGGPLVCHRRCDQVTLVGVVSFGIGCNGDLPGLSNAFNHN